jgi:phosphomannomutase
VLTAQISRYHSDKELALGLMITGSHGTVEDNGVKIVNVDGGLLPATLEGDLETFINSEDLSKDYSYFDKHLHEFFNKG